MPGTPVGMYQTLAQALMIDNVAHGDQMVSDIILAGSMFQALHAEPSSNGLVHSYTKTVTTPVIGFRNLGEPDNNKPGTKADVSISLKLLDCTVKEDAGRVESSPRGVDGYLSDTGLENLSTGFHTAEKQLFYGIANDTKGFVGLTQAAGYSALGAHCLDAGGRSANNVESIWVCRTGKNDLAAVYNEQMGGLTIDDYYKTQLNAYDNTGVVTGQFSGYAMPIMSWLGLQLGSVHSLIRIANVDVESATIEDHISKAINRFPSNKPPTHVVMSREARGGVKNGRTTFSPVGQRAPVPTEVDGIPIIISEALQKEAVVA